jgi:epoxyqueuosine reductase
MLKPASTEYQASVLVKRLAVQAGFDLVGIARIQELGEDVGRVTDWVEQGHHGTMGYMARNTDRRLDPTRILPGARSIVCVGLNYGEGTSEVVAGRGRIAR